MPRQARKKSENGIYHVMLRGVNKQEIFHDMNDRVRFLETLDRYSTESKVKVYGWCLMGNHVHLLMEEGHEDLAVTMKRINVSYVWYYNCKYETTGHLFQDRFKSEAVDSNEYLLTVIRYIHQNPVKAGMVNKCSDFKWSSCAGYYGNNYYPQGLLNTDMILKIFSPDKTKAIKLFKEFNETWNEDRCLEDLKIKRLSDEEAKKEIIKLNPDLDIDEIRALPKLKRDEAIKKIMKVEGLTQRQAARLLGVTPNIVFKV